MAEPAVHGEPGPHDGTARARPAGTPHPLDPLSADEIRARPRSCAASAASDERWRFASIELREPSKADGPRRSRPGDPIAREAEVICWNREDAQAYKARVALGPTTRRALGAPPGRAAEHDRRRVRTSATSRCAATRA